MLHSRLGTIYWCAHERLDACEEHAVGFREPIVIRVDVNTGPLRLFVDVYISEFHDNSQTSLFFSLELHILAFGLK
jgi:hypothetical protein